jgi:hypothetical protein
MNDICSTKNKNVYILFIYLIISLWLTGCKKSSKLGDHNMAQFERWSRLPWAAVAKERIQHAIDTYKNKTMDSTPILVWAGLGKPVGSEEIKIYLFILDEDIDLLGFTVNEVSTDPNGTSVALEEDYPIFAHCPMAVAEVNGYGFSISARNDEQRKDERLWADHVGMDFDARVKEQAGPEPPESADWSRYSQYADRRFELWKSSLPPIYISIPDSDKINVKIHVYDKAGNISNTVQLDAGRLN